MRKTLKALFILYLILNSFVSSGQEKNKMSYDLNKPDETYILPEYLEEVSGLTYYQPGQLAMLNDEHGRMFVYDLSKKKIVRRVRFEGKGDFEGIERVDDYIYAIKSNGKLYRFNVKIEGVVEKINTPFDSENDVEGLGYDPDSNQLLIALKASGDIKGVEVKGKAIYGYHLSSQEFTKTPLYIIKNKDLERVVGKKFRLRPSGVAVHPISRETYVVAASGNSLLVFDTEGKPKHLFKLRTSLFPQPEGIAFAPNGDMFISNEMDGEGGKILKFVFR